MAASANFPALLLALTWRRFNTTGAVVGVLVGVVSSVGLVIMSPSVWPGADGSDGHPFPLANPGLISIPLGFLACYLGTVLSGEEHKAKKGFDELLRAGGDRPWRRGRHRHQPDRARGRARPRAGDRSDA